MNKSQIAPEDENIKEVENLLIQLNIIIKSFSLYPSNHPLLSQSLAKFQALLQTWPDKENPLRIDIGRNKLMLRTAELGRGNEIFQKLAFFFFSRRLGEISFDPGASLQEITDFLTILNLHQDILKETGGIKSLLREKGISRIRVKEFSTKMADTKLTHLGEKLLAEDLTESDLAIIYKLLEKAPLEKEDEQKILLRLKQKPTEIAQLLKDLCRLASPMTEEGGEERKELLYKTIKKMGEVVLGELPDEQAYLFRNLSEAQLLLDRPTKSESVNKLLENIDQDSVAANLIGTFSNIELANLLAETLPYTHLSWEQIAHTLESLVQTQSHREEMLPLLIKKLSENEVARANLVPLLKSTKRKAEGPLVAKREELPSQEPAEIASKVGQYTKRERQQLEAMARLVNDQTTRIDATDTLIEMLFLEEKLENFSAIAKLLKTILSSFLMEKKFTLASKILSAFREQANRENLSAKHQEKIETILKDIVNRESIHQLINLIEAGEEVEQISHCFHLFGNLAITPLLEILGREDDMARRKTICSILADIGKNDLDALGSKISDKRWYLVRNIVGILGRIRNSETIKYLRETAKHPDHRVRSETVQALGAIKNQEAIELLAQLLNDKDLGVRQAAANWLGIAKAVEAVSLLIKILQKRDPFYRNLAMRKAAIQSLSQIGAKEATPILKKLVNKRAIFYWAKNTEIRNAAKEALEKIG